MARAVLLGGYGLIGAACLRALQDAGYAVTALGRDRDAARRVAEDVDWVFADLTTLSAADWREILQGADLVVNAAGALQDGSGDRLQAIHVDMVARLATALQDSQARLVQISAAGVSAQASTEFFRSKARGDEVIQTKLQNYVILRPTLVIGAAPYGGTALLRAAAAFPWVSFDILPESPIQTVALADVAEAVVAAAGPNVPNGTVADLTETGQQSLPELTSSLRHWLGFPPARLHLPMPQPVLWFLSAGADLFGHLGWRSPLRRTAIAALADGITGDATPWRDLGQPECRSLSQTLNALPTTVQDRWFARLYLAFPLMLAVLSLFWVSSGLIGLWQFSAAVDVMTGRGWTNGVSSLAVSAGILADLTLGLTVLWRRALRPALLGMVLIPIAYLLAGTVMTPDLWADPLGPFVKVLPAITLALVTLALTETR